MLEAYGKGDMGVNIKGIAEMAGVSVATISRVLNHPEKVLPETRQRVLEIMREQDYTPNWFARGLNRARTHTIALVVPNIENSTCQKIISGIETVAYNKQSTVFLCNTRNDPEALCSYLKMMLSRRVDGIILVTPLLKAEAEQMLSDPSVPSVYVGKYPVRGRETICYLDYEEGVGRLADHLTGLGHHSIDLLRDTVRNYETDSMEEGFHEARDKYGFTGVVHEAENTIQGGYIAARKILTRGELPDALITASHDQAFGVIKAAHDLDISIPGKLALSAMTNSDMCSIVSPGLTSLEQPALRLGMVAARMLFDRIENEEFALDVPQKVILQSTLKIRASCGNTKHIYEIHD
ncbi:transcriptional regulator, LacI family [Alkalispirochaeta americana]|uniref:Transcriptional regulator, LacI family n=1 Tax=Alkalispirochaeta americana TaxID=159291 RepID=A0A1N6WVW7_9SPIO|nr:LacI family DNA-binding transcriptional regulator [Alkalispirochaeta americana]SIQ94178.1 transcriptional regulator, LacI family [Alkalispirochaeta americana]